MKVLRASFQGSGRFLTAATSAAAAALLFTVPVLPAEFKLGVHTFTVPDGFEVELVAEPPLALRPMMADFDDEGRLYVADSSGSNEKPDKQLQNPTHRIVRLEDTNGDGKFDKSVVFADKLMFPEGVLYYDGAVYTGAPPTIWRLKDSNGDGVADERVEWFKGGTLTGCANDLHGPYLGVDGWIYWCKGAFAKQTHERPGHRTINDSAAHVFRCLPDGTELDAVMSGGMDNPVELAFTPEGELFFITTFFVNPQAGMRDAIAHCIYGGAYPKVHGVLDPVQRTGELLPPLTHLGPAAACSLTRYNSAAFGAEFQGNLFSSLFNMRKIVRHVLTPAGSTFTSKDQDFMVSNNPDFHPTDVFEDADGSLLVIDTGGWYKICCPTSQLAKPDVLGAIYRVKRKGMPKVDDPRGLKLAWSTMQPKQLAGLLDDPRPFVRKRAIHTLGKLGSKAVETLATTVRQGTTDARLNAIWALARIPGGPAREAVKPALRDSEASLRQAALHAVGLRRDKDAFMAASILLQDPSPAVQRKAAEALGRLENPDAVPALLESAAGWAEELPKDLPAAERIHEHALIFALIEIAAPELTAEGLKSPNARTRRAALIALDQMDHGNLKADQVTPLLGSTDGLLKSTALWILSHHPEWGGDLTAYYRERLTGKPGSTAEIAELESQVAGFARTEPMQKLLSELLAEGKLAPEHRDLALRAMGRSGLSQVPNLWQPVFNTILAGEDEAALKLCIASLKSVPLNRTNAGGVDASLLKLAMRGNLAAEVRLDALADLPGGLEEVPAALMELLLTNLDPALPVSQRSAAATVLARSKLADAQLLQLAESTKSIGPMELVRVLEAFGKSGNEAVGMKMVECLKAAKSFNALRIDLVKQRLAGFPESVQKAGQGLLETLNADLAQQTARLEKMLGELKDGDIRRGQAIFNSEKSACATCHSMGYLGGKVGPDLTSIGQIRTERDILEAIVYPSASFVRSYEPVAITTKDGEDYNGIVKDESGDQLLLVTGPTSEVRIPKANVQEMRPSAVSIMPQGIDEQLSKQDIADLVTFLKNTKWGAQ